MTVGQIFWRTRLSCFYCKVDGKMLRLSPVESEATSLREALLVEHGSKNPNSSDLITLYLEWVSQNNAESTFERRQRPLLLLSQLIGERDPNTIKPNDIRKWLKTHFANVGNTTEADLITIAQGCWTWGERNLSVQPGFKHMDKPSREKREFFLRRDRWQEVLNVCNEQQRPFFEFMFLTGARPQEARRLRKEHWFGNRFVLPPSQSKGERVGSTIYVPDELLPRFKTLPAGHVFVNTKGVPWTKSAINSVSRRVKKKISENEFCAYTCRHSFAADKVLSGVELAIVAKLMNHADTNMVYQRYGHLASQDNRLLAAVNS